MNRRQMFAAATFAAIASPALTQPSTPPSAAPSATPLFPKDAEFWFETLRMFGADEYGGASFGEVLETANRIKAGDYDSWYDGWNNIADRIAAEADDQFSRRHRVSARDSYLRASNYYRSSEFFLHGDAQDPRISHAYRRSVDCYKAAATLYDPPIEPVEIPYDGKTLAGYLHRAAGSERKRPLLILHTGFDGSAEEMHWSGARAAVERGYHVLVFDGPGQFGARHRDGLTFRPDWEKVVTPVVDFAVSVKGVDTKRIALRGDSMGGYLAPRAAAFEPRIAALIANDGLYDYSAPFFTAVPESARAAFRTMVEKGSSPTVDKLMEGAMKASPVARWSITHGMWSFGSTSPSDYMHKTLAYNLSGGIAERIRCPTLVCDADGDLFFKGQPQQLFSHLTCPKTMITFTSEEGAGAHCEVGAARLASARMFDWLDETLAVG